MKLKTLAVTVALLAILSAVVYYANRPAPRLSSDPRVNQPLVDTATVEKAARIQISDQGKSVELAKQPDGSWQVVSYYGFPADFQKLSDLVGNLTSAKVEQFVTALPEKLTRLEFKDTKIVLSDPAGKPFWSVTLGKTADAGGRFVRFDDEKKGYRANLTVWLDAQPKDWADSTLVPVKPEQVARVELPLPEGGSVTATRAKKEDPFTAADAPSGQKLKSDKITSLLSSLTSLRFTETTAPDDPNAAAAKQHERTVTLTTFDGKTLTVALGRKPEQKIVKPPAAKPDGKSGPAALGKVSDATKGPEKPENTQSGPAKVGEPEVETIPAGPVFAFVTDSDAAAPINGMMKKRAFQVYDYVFTSLPEKRSDLFEAAPAPAPAATAAESAAKKQTPPAATAAPVTKPAGAPPAAAESPKK